MNNVDIIMNLANVVNLIAVLLLMRAVIKDRNKLKGYSVSGTFLTFIAILGFEIGFYLMGNYFSFGLGLANLVFWFMVFVFSFRNFIHKKGERIEMRESKPVQCQKCGKPVGYISLLTKSIMGIQQPVHNIKIVAICMECSQK